MAKARRPRNEEKTRFHSRDAIIGLVVIVAVLLAIALVVWLMMPVAGQKPIPRKSRGIPLSSLDTRTRYVACNYCEGLSEAAPMPRILSQKPE